MGRNKKLAPKWLGPATIIETTETNVKIKCANNKIKLLNVSHIKPFVLDKSSHPNVYPEEDNFDPENNNCDSPPTFDYLDNPPSHPVTRSLTRLLHEQHSINFVQIDLKDKLSRICEKLYKLNVPFNFLSTDEQLLWSAYDIDDIMFFLTGDQNFCPDYTVYNCVRKQTPIVLPQPQPAIMPQPEGPWAQHRAVVDARNIVEGPRACQAKTLANRLIYLQARSHSHARSQSQ